MFNRVRERVEYDPTWCFWNIEEADVKEAVTEFCGAPHRYITETPMSRLYPLRYSRGTISDFVVLPKVKHKFVRRNVLSGLPRAVKPVHHTRVSIDRFKDVDGSPAPDQGAVTFVQSSDELSSNSDCSQTYTKTQTCPPLAFLAGRYGSDYIKNEILDNLSETHDPAIQFAEVEWSALADQFDESCKSLIPSSFFSGEFIYEGGIFVDAFKLVMNPTKAISGFIKNVRKRGLHRMRLGELNRYYLKLFDKKKFAMTEEGINTANDLGLTRFYLKEGIGQHLSYKFGVVPAIHDTRETIKAHSTVEARLFYLNQHRGRYVPIRVKKGFPASFIPGTPESSPYLGEQVLLRDAFTVAHIFGQGRIRTDINEASRWRAYSEYFGLNKVVGTAWELIPFSFVVDWFTNSQEAINKLTRIPLGESPFMNLTAVGHSVKKLALYDYKIIPGYDLSSGIPNFSPDSPTTAFSFAVTEYDRYPGFPDTSWFANPSNLGLFHGIVGGELLLQKFL